MLIYKLYYNKKDMQIEKYLIVSNTHKRTAPQKWGATKHDN